MPKSRKSYPSKTVSSSETTAKLAAALKNVLKKWESLPEGFHTVESTQEWLIKDMKPAMNKIRKILAETGYRNCSNCRWRSGCDACSGCRSYSRWNEGDPQ